MLLNTNTQGSPLPQSTAVSLTPPSAASAGANATDVCHHLFDEAPKIRLLVILAHPDDEILALGGCLELLTRSRLICVTDGVPLDGADARTNGFSTLDGYRKARHSELVSALASFADDPIATHSFDVPDQRAAYDLAGLTRRVAAEVQAFTPDAILTHPYEGGHPDHDACAFAVAHCRSTAPIIEAPFYHAGNHGIQTGAFIGDPGITAQLSPTQQARKQHRLAAFRSQADTLRLFGTHAESYRPAPAYDFHQPPHDGKLYYENFDWGMTGDRFRSLAVAAEAELATWSS